MFEFDKSTANYRSNPTQKSAYFEEILLLAS